LSSPVVDIPVVFVKEEVVLPELGGRHGGEVGRGKGREEQVGLKDSSFSALVWRACKHYEWRGINENWLKVAWELILVRT
jgi:hypothetical protein